MMLRNALLATVMFAAIPAEAATYLITYQGTVGEGSDVTGEFGLAGQSLSGLGFTSVFTLTSPLAGAFTFDNGFRANIFGGLDYGGVPSPVTSALTINGITKTMENQSSSFAAQENRCCVGGQTDIVAHNTNYTDPDGGSDGTFFQIIHEANIQSSVNDFLATQDYTAPLNYSVQPGDYSLGSFAILEYANFGGDLSNYSRIANGRLNATSVTISAIDSAVPEPASWAMMILGFGLLGGAMRRRQEKITVRYA